MTEYVLVLVTVILVFFAAGGFLRQFNASFEGFIRNYYGEYLKCLLETGELPTLGYNNASSECNDEFSPFTIAAGRPQIANPGAGGRGNGNVSATGSEKGEGTKAREQTTASNNSEGRGSSGGASESSGASAGALDGPQLLDRDTGRQRNVPLSQSDLGKNGGKSSLFAAAQTGGGGGDGNGDGRPKFVPAEGPEGERNANTGLAAAKSAEGEEKDLAPRRVPAEMNKNKSVVKAEEPWSFPDFLKWLIIAALILAMFVFFGGQAMQISKGGDD